MARRHALALVALGAGTLAIAPLAAGATTRAAAVPPLRFSHEVVTDEQRDGFEPDIQVGPGDVLYTSVPNGSSTTLSWLWTSTDHGNSFHLAPGNVAATGRLINCPQGGGDTEETLDAKGDLFFSDLQNLTNLTNSVSTDGGRTFLSSCVGAVNTPVDRMWYALHGSLGSPGFRIYEEYDAVDSSLSVGNQLVLEASTNGVTFTPVLNPAATSTPGCIGGGITNCVTGSEGISGNVVTAPNGDVVMAHSSSDRNLAVVTRGVITGTYPLLEGKYRSGVVNGPLCPDFAVTATNMGRSEICGTTNFATIAEDSAGRFYTAFSSARETVENVGGSPTLVPTGPYEVYVSSSADGLHWSRPVQVSTTGSNAFPWITAGSEGRVAVAWYSASETHEAPAKPSFAQSILDQLGNADPHGYLFDELNHAEFNVDVAESTDALSSSPHYSVALVTEHPVKYGAICTQGTLCEVTQGDRSLGDFLEVNHDARGALILTYVDDTSGYFSVGPTGAVADNGPNVVVREISGPSLLATKPAITGAGGGPGAAMGSVSDPANDDFASANGSLTPAGANLDLLGASLGRDASGLIATMRIKSLASLLVSPATVGTTGEWIMRFTTYDPHQNGNGHIYYAGMESILGAAPRFFAGEPTREKELAALGSSAKVMGSYNARTGTITIHIPFSAIGGHSRPGTEFYSATAFTGTTIGTLERLPISVISQTDATPPFDYVLPPAGSSRSAAEASASASPGGSSARTAGLSAGSVPGAPGAVGGKTAGVRSGSAQSAALARSTKPFTVTGLGWVLIIAAVVAAAGLFLASQGVRRRRPAPPHGEP